MREIFSFQSKTLEVKSVQGPGFDLGGAPEDTENNQQTYNLL